MILPAKRNRRAVTFTGNPMGSGGDGGAGGETPYGVHRYWRLLCTEVQSTSYALIAEMQMRLTPGGSDQASALDYLEGGHHSTFDGSNAFDDDSGTFWSFDISGGLPDANAWVGQDFGEGNEIGVYEVTVQTRSSFNQNQTPREFDIQYSDDSVSWTTAWSVVTESWNTSLETRTFTSPLLPTGTSFDYNDIGQGGANSASGYSAKGNVVQPTGRLEITHMGGVFGSAVTGEFVLARVAEADGEILEILASVSDVAVSGGGAWTDVEFPASVTVYPDQFYLLCFNRTDSSGTAPSQNRFSTLWEGARQTKVTGWRNDNSGPLLLGDTNESPNAAGWTLDWKGTVYYDPEP